MPFSAWPVSQPYPLSSDAIISVGLGSGLVVREMMGVPWEEPLLKQICRFTGEDLSANGPWPQALGRCHPLSLSIQPPLTLPTSSVLCPASSRSVEANDTLCPPRRGPFIDRAASAAGSLGGLERMWRLAGDWG